MAAFTKNTQQWRRKKRRARWICPCLQGKKLDLGRTRREEGLTGCWEAGAPGGRAAVRRREGRRAGGWAGSRAGTLGRRGPAAAARDGRGPAAGGGRPAAEGGGPAAGGGGPAAEGGPAARGGGWRSGV